MKETCTMPGILKVLSWYLLNLNVGLDRRNDY